MNRKFFFLFLGLNILFPCFAEEASVVESSEVLLEDSILENDQNEISLSELVDITNEKNPTEDPLLSNNIDLFIQTLLEAEKNKQILTEDDEKIIYAMLMNQIQYSISNITHYKNKVVLEREFDNIINRIDKTKLKDIESLEIFNQILSKISALKLLENEKEFVQREADKSKKNAINKAFNSFGSVFNPGITPQQLVASLVYTGASAAFNYRNAVNEVNQTTNKQLFEISQSVCRTIDNSRIDLFNTSTRFINKYEMPKRFEIKEDKMVDLVDLLDGKEPDSVINLLETQKNVYALFLPYWYELGSAYQKIGNFEKAKENYSIFEALKDRYSIIDNDPYYTELSKNMIEILYKEGNLSAIEKYVSIIENDENVANESSNRYYLAQIYYLLGKKEKAFDYFKLVIDRGAENTMAARSMCQFIDYTYSDDKASGILFNMKNVIIKENKKNGINIFIPETDANHITNIGIVCDGILYSGARSNKKQKNTVVVQGVIAGPDSLQKNQREIFSTPNVCFTFKKSKKILKKSNFSLLITFDNEEYQFEFDRYSVGKKEAMNIDKALSRIDVSSRDFENADLRSFNIGLSSVKLLDGKALRPDSERKRKKKNKNGDFDSIRTEHTIKKELQKEAKRINEIWISAQKDYIKGIRPYCSLVYSDSEHNKINTYTIIGYKDSTNNYQFNKYGLPFVYSTNLQIEPGDINDEVLLQAKKGDANSQVIVANIYIQKENFSEARKWLEMAANSNNEEALYLLGIMYEQGIGIKKDKKKAKYCYTKSAELGYGAARLKVIK